MATARVLNTQRMDGPDPLSGISTSGLKQVDDMFAYGRWQFDASRSEKALALVASHGFDYKV
jgi:hypothetical protein